MTCSRRRGVRAVGVPCTPQDASGELVALVNHVLPGASITYTFTPQGPGTFQYQSGTYPHRQIPMGLYGALVVRPIGYNPNLASNKTAYGTGTGSEFDREYLIITASIDPSLSQAVRNGQGASYQYNNFKPRYWMMNGRAAPDTMLPDQVAYFPSQPYGASIMGTPEEKILLRYVGAGVQQHPLHLHGNHTRIIARDGRLLKNGLSDLSYLRFTILLGPGQTCDHIFSWSGLGYTPSQPIPTVIPNVRNMVLGPGNWTMSSNSPYLGEQGELPVGLVSYNMDGEYTFMLHSHEEIQITNWSEFPGGLMTMLSISPVVDDMMGHLE